MVLPVAIALMAAAGHRKYKQDQIDDQEAVDTAQARREDRAYLVGERARATKQRDDTAAAAAPTTVDEAPMAMPIGSRDEPRAPEAVGIRAAGKTFTSRAEADKAAADYNAEPAVAKRVANVARMSGDYAGSQQVMNLSRQGRMADMQLKTAEEGAARDAKLREMGGALIQGGWAAVPGVYDQYNDGHKAEVIEDGKGGATVVKRSADGTEVGRKQFASLPEFFAGVAGQFDPKLWLDRQDKQAETTRAQDNLDREFKRKTGESDRDFQLRKAEAERKAKHDAAMLANDSARVGIARMAAAGKTAGAEPVPATAEATFDRKTASDIAKDQVQKEADEARGAGKVWTAQQIAQRTDAIVQAQFATHAARFDQAAFVRTLAATQNDPVAYAEAFEKAKKYGLPLGDLAKMGFKPPAPSGQATPPTKGAPSVAAAPAAPADASGVAQVGAQQPKVPFQQFVAQNITTPAGKQAISQRIAKELPELQYQIDGDTKVMAMPMVSGAVRARLKARVDAAAQEAQMMQSFIAGNPGI